MSPAGICEGLRSTAKVTLSTILLVLFSLTNNPQLLSLHAKQQSPTAKGENAVHFSAWMKALVHALIERLGEYAGVNYCYIYIYYTFCITVRSFSEDG